MTRVLVNLPIRFQHRLDIEFTFHFSFLDTTSPHCLASSILRFAQLLHLNVPYKALCE